MSCEECKDENATTCCHYTGICEAAKTDNDMSTCIHCGGEMHKVNRFWYHHTQFDDDGNLISPENPQWEE